jgi:hypothetical protein
MRRASIAMAGGLLIAALLPGSVLAGPISGLDQYNAPGTQKATGGEFFQTFTAGRTGLLDEVALWASSSPCPPLGYTAVAIWPVRDGKPDLSGYPIGESGPGYTGAPARWVPFYMVTPAPVVAGTQYALGFYLADRSDYALFAFGSGDTYSGGQALVQTGPTTFGPVSAKLLDFSFQTSVEPQTTALAWSQTHLTAGVATRLTLTETFVFPQNGSTYVLPALGPLVPPGVPSVKVDAAPAFFVATTIACSSQIARADCKLSNESPGPGFPVAPDGDPVTITLSGIASPTAADVGSSFAAARGCVAYVGEVKANDTTVCVEGRAPVVVVGPGATPPPTTASAPPSKDSGLPLLLVACFGAAACGMVLTIGRRARRFS